MSDESRGGGMWRTIDHVLRGHFTRPQDLVGGKIDVPTPTVITAALLLGALYGGFMGLFSVLRTDGSAAQCVASIVKVPLLFLLTLLVTLPSLYVVSALFDSRLRFLETLRLLVLAILVDLALLASFGPVTAFFTLSTTSYPFMVLLNVAFFAISGFVGLAFLRRALDGVFAPPPDAPPDAATENAPRPAVRTIRVEDSPKRVFRVWILIYAVVGAQMGWILRPFIGNPALPFTPFRPRGSNFFEAVLDAIHQLSRN